MTQRIGKALWRAAAATFVVLVCATGGVASQGNDTIAAKRSAILTLVHNAQKHKQTLVGVQVNEYEVYLDCTSYDRIVAQTGKHPAILGLELMNAIAYPPYEKYLIDRAETQTEAGGLVTMSWHERNPVEVCARGEFFDCVKKPMSADTLKAVLTEGTPEHKLWLADVDALAKILGDLRDRGIVVLFRPYHEMNREWFWWGKQSAYPQLWDALYDELAVRQHLDNLIWVWSIDRDAPDPTAYFPVRYKPDVVGIDVYEHDPDSPKYLAGHAAVTALAGKNTPFAFTEVGVVPSAKVLDAANPAWVLLWGEEFLNSAWTTSDCPACNKPEQVADFFKLDRIVTLDKIPAAVRRTIAKGTHNEHPLHAPNPSCPVTLH